MPEEYLTDDEQLEHVKRLTAEYGPWMLGAVVLGLAFVFGFRYYEGYRNERAMQAASQFTDMTSALQHNDRAQGAADCRRPDQGLTRIRRTRTRRN